MPAISTPNAVDPDARGAGQGTAGGQHPAVHTGAAAWRVPACLVGVVLGAALQLQQPGLWRGAVYGVCLVLACVLGGGAWWVGSRLRWRTPATTALALGAAALAMFAVCGLRAAAFAGQGLAPALEGRDIRVTGVIAAMPQSNEAGTRIRMQVETAMLDGAPVQLPARIEVAWYGGAFRDGAGVVDLQRAAPALTAGERWALTVRLKAPHGLRNPHGFAAELWMWEQGVQATG